MALPSAQSAFAQDLVVESLVATWDVGQAPGVGDQITLHATIRNIGAAPTGAASLVGFELHAESAPTDPAALDLTDIVPPLDPGESVVVRRIGVQYGAAGNWQAWAWVDPFDAIAEEIEDNNAAPTPVIVRLPDFRVQSITRSPSGLIPLFQNFSVTVTVINDGGNMTNAPPQGMYVSLFPDSIAEPAPCPPTQLLYASSFPGGETREFRFTGLYYQTGGLHRLWAWADSCNFFPEESETNNNAHLDIEVGVPDLIVESVTVDPENPIAGQLAELGITIRNIGSVASLNVPVGVVLDAVSPSPCADWIPYTTMGPIPPGATQTIYPQVVYPQAETVMTWVMVDYCNTITESNEQNNIFNREVVVVEDAPGLPDLIVESLAVTPPNPYAGQTVTFTAVVKNVGTADAGPFWISDRDPAQPPLPPLPSSVSVGDPFAACSGICGPPGVLPRPANPPLPCQIDSASVTGLFAGARVSVTFRWRFPNSGSGTFRVWADVCGPASSGEIAESSEGNNSRSMPFTVRQCNADGDGDGICNDVDNCPTVANPGQADLDSDGIGDECDDDIDGDGVLNADDCGPRDRLRYPGAPEICDDAIDNDCDGRVDGADSGCPTWYRDADGDGFGVFDDRVAASRRPDGYSRETGDCDDTDEFNYPGAPQRCDGIDRRCYCDEAGKDCERFGSDEAVWWRDADADGFGDPLEVLRGCNDIPVGEDSPPGYVVGGFLEPIDPDDADFFAPEPVVADPASIEQDLIVNARPIPLAITLSRRHDARYMFEVTSDPPAWLHVSPRSGSSTGGEATLLLNLDSTGLERGAHTHELKVSVNGHSLPPIRITLQARGAKITLRFSGDAPMPLSAALLGPGLQQSLLISASQREVTQEFDLGAMIRVETTDWWYVAPPPPEFVDFYPRGRDEAQFKRFHLANDTLLATTVDAESDMTEFPETDRIDAIPVTVHAARYSTDHQVEGDETIYVRFDLPPDALCGACGTGFGVPSMLSIMGFCTLNRGRRRRHSTTVNRPSAVR